MVPIKFIKEKKKLLVCQECGGYGDIFEVDSYYACGWCKGLGEVAPSIRAIWLNYKKKQKARNDANRVIIERDRLNNRAVVNI